MLRVGKKNASCSVGPTSLAMFCFRANRGLVCLFLFCVVCVVLVLVLFWFVLVCLGLVWFGVVLFCFVLFCFVVCFVDCVVFFVLFC